MTAHKGTKASIRLFDWLAKKFGESGYRAVLCPEASFLVNWYIDFAERRALKPYTTSLRERTIIDVGCGMGRWTVPLAKQNNPVLALDISKEMIKLARERVRKEGLSKMVDFVVASVSAIPCISDSFNLGLCVTTLQHIIREETLTKAVSEMIRVVKSTRGKFLIMEQTRLKRRVTTYYPTIYRTKQEYEDLFASQKGRVTEYHGVDLLPFLEILYRIKDEILSLRLITLRDQMGERVPSLWYKVLLFVYLRLTEASVLLSMPIDLLLHEILKKYTLHKLFIIRALD